MLLLCTDLHLDDVKANEYRWNVFGEISRVCHIYGPISTVYCLGDAIDKKDRHSAELVNRFVSSWDTLPVDETVILLGNHDKPLRGPPFWEFMSKIPGLGYVTHPTPRGNLLLLPFSANPTVEWGDLSFRDYKAAFLHATPKGALAENGFTLAGSDLPAIPRSLRIYSGDVHTPQVVRNWTLVGAPHPIDFGDDHPYRFLLLDESTYEVVEEVPVKTIGKRVVEVTSLDDLEHAEVRRGDQVSVRASITPGSIDWGTFEGAVDEWARARGVEVTFGGSYDLPLQTSGPSEELSPEEILKAFAAEEGVTGDLLGVGLELLREVRE